MTKFFNSENPVFCSLLVHFPNFWGKFFLSKKSSSVKYNFIWVSSTMPKFRKTNEAIPRKGPDREKEGQTDLISQDLSSYPLGSNDSIFKKFQCNVFSMKETEKYSNSVHLCKEYMQILLKTIS